MEYQTKMLTEDQMDKLICESKWPMNSLSILIPYKYAKNIVKLNWHDILFAIENGYFSLESAVEHATLEVQNNESCQDVVVELACLLSDQTNRNSIYPYISKLANAETDKKKRQSKEKIMYVLLNWVFEHKNKYSDPLKVVEIIYDDFGFPESISSFVQYMPTDSLDLGSVELNRERLFNEWKSYLITQEKFWKEE
jgi:hypothetical protein